MIDANCVLAICPHFEVRFLEDEDLNAVRRAKTHHVKPTPIYEDGKVP